MSPTNPRHGLDIYGNPIDFERSTRCLEQARQITKTLRLLLVGAPEPDADYAVKVSEPLEAKIAEALYFCPVEAMRQALLGHALAVEEWRARLIEEACELRGMVQKFLEVDREIRHAITDAGGKIIPYPGPPQAHSTKDWTRWIKQIFSTKKEEEDNGPGKDQSGPA